MRLPASVSLLLRWLWYLELPVAFTAFSLTAFTLRLADENAPLDPAFFTAVGVYAVYTFDRLLGIKAADTENFAGKIALYLTYPRLIACTGLTAAGAGLWWFAVTELPVSAIVCVLLTVGAGYFYSFHYYLIARRQKAGQKAAGLNRMFILLFCWLNMTVIFPLSVSGTLSWENAGFAGGVIVLWLTVNSMIFDLRDYHTDAGQNIRTLLGRFERRVALHIALGWCVFAAAVSMVLLWLHYGLFSVTLSVGVLLPLVGYLGILYRMYIGDRLPESIYVVTDLLPALAVWMYPGVLFFR